MGSVGVDLVVVQTLKRIPVNGGDVMHAMKITDERYKGFGEAYFSWVNRGAVKAWKLHKEMTLNLIVPLGEVKFVFTSPDEPGKFRTEYIGTSNYARVTVPPGLWFGFSGLAEQNLVLNIANIIHEPTESLKEVLSYFDFDWSI
jgi:dTDP-4-dehydrorhamnose 3,5-epimerase